MTETNPTHETTGGRLARLRRAQNITQEELAERLGISRQAVSKWESDLAYPETDKLLTLSRLYGCTVDYLLTGEEPVPPCPEPKPEPQAASATTAPLTRLGDAWSRRPHYFEYKSRRTLGNLPLVHINIGWGRKATGVLAIGLAARGIFSLGLASVGVLSVGLCSVGLLSLGIFALGLLLAVGSIAVGAVAVGAIAVGILAIGALSVGLISVGALAVGYYVALGDHAYGMIAAGGTVAEGTVFSTVSPTHHVWRDELLPEALSLVDKYVPTFLRGIAKFVLRMMVI
ncbi:MAG: helix-turn-helix transcriptional regulator [Ruminococcaceae bacterium]|nr:helix-turn-helix transcriptional regulator [Oscillospiraceae bacterium]